MEMHSYTAIVEKEGEVYVALCPELDVASPKFRRAPSELSMHDKQLA